MAAAKKHDGDLDGASNSQSSYASVVFSVGIDTASFAWRTTNGAMWNRLAAATKSGWLDWPPDESIGECQTVKIVPSVRGSFLFADPVLGMRVGFYPEHDLVFAEGRVASIARITGPRALLPVDQLEAVADEVALELSSFGLPFWGVQPVIRRLDLAADLTFENPATGQALLAQLSALELPRLKRTVWASGEQVETVYFRTPKQRKTHIRIYDKALQSGSGDRGSIIRIERQLRYPKAAQLKASELAAFDPGELWLGPMTDWLVLSGGLTLANYAGSQHQLVTAVENGILRPVEAERMCGFLALRALGKGHSWWRECGSGHIPRRRLQELSALGIVVHEDGNERPTAAPQRVEVGALIRGLRDAWQSTSSTP